MSKNMVGNKEEKKKDIEIIKKIDTNRNEVQLYSFDKRLKRKSHFQIKYDFVTKTDIKTNTENRINSQLSSQQDYSKDSFERFGDDLCEFVLNFLTLKQKFRYETVSRQWRHLIFNRQAKLNLTNLSSDKYDIDSIDGLLSLDIRQLKIVVNQERLQLVLKKCTRINEIYINFNKRFIRPGLIFAIDGNVFEIFQNYCHSMKKLTICSEIENLSNNQMKTFVAKFGKSLNELRFKYSSDSLIKEFIGSGNFPKLNKLDFNTIKRESEDDLIKQLGTTHLSPKLSHLKYTFSGFDGLQMMTGPDFGRLQTLDIVLDTELCPQLSGSGVDRALRQISHLKGLHVFNVKIFTEDTTITPIDTGLERIANNCLHIRRLDFIMDDIVLLNKLFDIFSQFRALEYCEISIEYNEELEDYGSIEQFRHCQSLRVFNLYLYNICDKHLVDIDVYIPKMTNFHLRSRNGITDSTLKYLKNCKKLEVLEIHTYEDRTALIEVTDGSLSQLIKSCPKLRIVLVFSGQKIFSFDKSIEQMAQKARLRPKIKHIFGFKDVLKLCKRFAEKHKRFEESSLLLPLNLRLIELPHWTGIQCFDYYCNYETPD